MSDDAEKAAQAAGRVGVIGLAAYGADAAGFGALGALAAGTLAEGIATFFQLVASGNAEALMEWRAGSIREDVAKLVARVEKLELELRAEMLPPDRSDPLSREQTVSDFVRDVASAHTQVKREALVNAAANQHDPRIGGQATRAFWYRVLRELPDVEVFIIRLMAKHGHIVLWRGELIAVGEQAGNHRTATAIDVGGEDTWTLHSTILEMAGSSMPQPRRVIYEEGQAEPNQMLLRGQLVPVAQRYAFTAGGRFLASLIAD
jgi:hypothetical protein